MFDDLIGKPYIENGRGPDGYDCYGVWMEVNRRLGVELPEQELILKGCKFKKVDTPQAGDAVLIITGEGPHVAAAENETTIIHTSCKMGNVHRVKIDNPQVAGRIQGFYRYVR